MLRRAQQGGCPVLFHAAAVLHHGHRVSKLSHDAQVVRNKQQAHVQLVAQFAQQLQNLRLHRDVQRGGGFIGNQQFRAREQGHCNHHALALAAGKLVREIVQPFRRITDTGAFKAVQNFTPRCLFTHSPMKGQHFIELFFQGMQWVERHHRLLKNHGDVVATNAAQGLLVSVQQRLSMEQNIPLRIADRRGREQAQHRQRRNALTGAGFPDQRQRLSALDLQR